MKPLDPSNWYWSPEKLNTLVKTIKGMCSQDEDGLYIDGRPLGRSVMKANRKVFNNDTQMRHGIGILVFLKILEPGTRSNYKPQGYKRRFYPPSAQITWTEIKRYRDHTIRKQSPGRFKD